MSDTQQSDRRVLEAIRRGDAEAWSRLIDEYQGRLLRFALVRAAQPADAEDIVQDTFTSFIKVVNNLQIQVSLETYLFGILRNEIVNRFRTRWARAVCLIQDVYRTGTDDAPGDPLAQVSAPGPSVTWYVGRGEQRQLQQQILSETLHHLVGDLQKARKFRDLKIAELVFYGQLSGAAVARLLDVDKVLVRVVEHRCLKRSRADVLAHSRTTEISLSLSEDLLTEVWEAQRLSCPKRSTLGAFLLETLSPEWFDYVDFHLTTLGCHFCRASFKDLQEQQGKEQRTSFRRRILTSTAGFLSSA